MTSAGITPKERRQRARAARRCARIFDDLRAESGLPTHLAATLASAALDDVVALLDGTDGANAEPIRARLQALADGGDDADLLRRASTVSDDGSRTALVEVLGDARAFARDAATMLGRSGAGRIGRWMPLIARVAAVLVPAAAIVTYFMITRPVSPIDMQLDGRAGGIEGVYFKGTNFEKEVGRRVDSVINFDFGNGGPMSETGSDEFSVRWDGYLRFRVGGLVAVCVRSDDGSDLHLNGKHIVDNWGTHPKKTRCKRLRVRQGWYPIRVAYNEVDGDGSMALMRGLDKDSARPVPASDLCCRR